MAVKKPVAVVFVHGLAKKPPRDKLLEIWQWGLSRDNPMPSVFLPPNTGIDLSTRGVPQYFNTTQMSFTARSSRRTLTLITSRIPMVSLLPKI